MPSPTQRRTEGRPDCAAGKQRRLKGDWYRGRLYPLPCGSYFVPIPGGTMNRLPKASYGDLSFGEAAMPPLIAWQATRDFRAIVSPFWGFPGSRAYRPSA